MTAKLEHIENKLNQEVHDSFSAVQVSGMDDKDNYILSVLAKAKFKLDDAGWPHLTNNKPELIGPFEFYKDTNDALLMHDSDMYPYKKNTDVIVKGFAQTTGGAKSFISQVSIGGQSAKIFVLGDRRAYLTDHGKIIFSEPEMVERVPLRYDFAYGGWDKRAEYNIETHNQKKIDAIADVIDWQSGSAYMYPRNPLGKGYVVELNKKTIDSLELPNLEDDRFRLTPENVVAGDRRNWTFMPIPRCMDWVNLNWFPRSSYFGLPEHRYKYNPDMYDVMRGWTNDDVINESNSTSPPNMKSMNGASLGLQIPFPKEGERCKLVNLHPHKHTFDFRLPQTVPSLFVDGRNGKLIETHSVVHTILISPDENELTILWRGSAKAKRPYLDHELENMPFKVLWGD